MKLERIILIVAEPDQAPLPTNPVENRVRLENMVFPGAPLDDGDLVVPVIPICDRGRMNGRGCEKDCDQEPWCDTIGKHTQLREPDTETRYFFFFAAGFLAAFFAAGFLAALAIVVSPSIERPADAGPNLARLNVGPFFNVVRINLPFKRIFPVTTIEDFDR